MANHPDERQAGTEVGEGTLGGERQVIRAGLVDVDVSPPALLSLVEPSQDHPGGALWRVGGKTVWVPADVEISPLILAEAARLIDREYECGASAAQAMVLSVLRAKRSVEEKQRSGIGAFQRLFG